MDLNVCYQRDKSLPFQVIVDEVVVIAPQKWQHHLLQGVGREIWALLVEPVSGETIVTAIGKEFDASEDQIREDVETFLSQLLDVELIAAVI